MFFFFHLLFVFVFTKDLKKIIETINPALLLEILIYKFENYITSFVVILSKLLLFLFVYRKLLVIPTGSIIVTPSQYFN